jgi:Fe-S-cluster-containing hydrogenase component 2
MNDLNHGAVPGAGFAPPPGGEVDAPLRQAYGELRRLPLFDGIPNEELWRVIAAGGIQRAVYERDHFVADPSSVIDGSAARIFLVASGQIAVAVFEPGELANRKTQQEAYERMTREERQELSALRPEPLSRLARKNLATFMDGDLFNAGALASGSRGDVAFYTVSPAVVAGLAHAAIADLAVRFPFFEARLRRAIELSRDRLRNIAGVKQEILDFFIRQGISVSGEMVRVRQLDSCIDCKLCEQACEDRYGSRRLTLGGYQLGMLDFVFTCRTCTDQRCIDPCEYDSIKFDPEIREVVINETSCTGCTLCARSCPYSAIEMVDVEDPQNPNFRLAFKQRLEGAGALAFGAGKPRVARPRRIANKCDHCMSYGDQACVSACPTGSLIEINAYELFRERTPAAAQLARTGFDQDLKSDHSEILPTEPFTQGVGVRDAGMAKVRRGRVAPVVFWGLALAAWFLALAEIMLRIYRPESSLQYVMLRADGLEPVIAKLKVGYRAGTDLAVNCGYVGTGLMLLAILYTPLRRLKAFRRIASNTMWFDFHMMAGTMGPMFIVLHSALKLDNWVSAAFWSMIIVVTSGVIGRYLYTQVPDLLNGRELEELDHPRALGKLRAQYPQAAQVADQLIAAQRGRAQHVAERRRLVGAFLWILAEDLRRPFRWLTRKGKFRAAGAPRRVARDMAYRTGRLLLVERRRVLVPRAQLLLHTWKKVHVPFSFIMAAIASVHIWLAFQYSL